MAEKKRDDKEDRRVSWGMFIPAGLFIGLGLGFAFGGGIEVIAGALLGLGVGFLCAGIASLIMNFLRIKKQGK